MIYEHERKETKRSVRIHALPYPPHADGYDEIMHEYLASRELSWKIAEDNLWYVSKSANDTYARIVIPCQSRYERHNYWQARAIDPNAKVRYQSPYASRLDAICVASNRASDSTTAVVCEGPMDALAAAGMGHMGIAIMGNTPPDIVLDHVVYAAAGRKLFVVADSDANSPWASIFVRLVQRKTSPTLVRAYPYNDIAKMDKNTRKDYLSLRTLGFEKGMS